MPPRLRLELIAPSRLDRHQDTAAATMAEVDTAATASIIEVDIALLAFAAFRLLTFFFF